MIPPHVLADAAAMAFCIMADHAVDLLTSMEDCDTLIAVDERECLVDISISCHEGWRTEMAKA